MELFSVRNIRKKNKKLHLAGVCQQNFFYKVEFPTPHPRKAMSKSFDKLYYIEL